MPNLVKQSFHAWIDTGNLIVTGDLKTPTLGWKAEIKAQVPPGINPQDLLLRVDAQPPTGPAGQIVTNVPLRYQQAAGNIKTVTVFYEKESVHVHVEPAP
jgi:hypothetical protein